MASDVMMNFDVESVSDVASFVYSNIPYFLSDADYRRIDSLLAIPDYTAQQLARNKESLMFPSSGMLYLVGPAQSLHTCGYAADATSAPVEVRDV